MTAERATRWSMSILLAILALGPAAASAATSENFFVRATADLVALCNSPPSDEMHVAAIHFCEGYVVGANHFYLAERAGSGGPQIYCLPNPPPSRDVAIATFVRWAQSHPEYMNERPVDSLMRFAASTWPCRK